ncbi:MAG: preprotein translocase subunit SecG [Magnetococcus sp. YQC-5]
MTLILTVLHILVCISLVFVVLLQKGSGADMGAAFGGSSQSLFGARGSGDFLSKLTAGLATIFMITSLTLAFFTTRPSGTSVMDKAPIATPDKPASGKTSDKAETPAPAKEPEKTESGPPVPAKSTPTKEPGAQGAAVPPVPPAANPAKPVPPPPPAEAAKEKTTEAKPVPPPTEAAKE